MRGDLPEELPPARETTLGGPRGVELRARPGRQHDAPGHGRAHDERQPRRRVLRPDWTWSVIADCQREVRAVELGDAAAIAPAADLPFRVAPPPRCSSTSTAGASAQAAPGCGRRPSRRALAPDRPHPVAPARGHREGARTVAVTRPGRRGSSPRSREAGGAYRDLGRAVKRPERPLRRGAADDRARRRADRASARPPRRVAPGLTGRRRSDRVRPRGGPPARARA